LIKETSALELIYQEVRSALVLYFEPLIWIRKAAKMMIGKVFKHRDPILTVPPGTYLTWLAGFLSSSKTLERIARPVISDMQVEYFEALSRGRKTKALWVLVRGYWSFWKALALHNTLKNLAAIRKISKLG
jgi:hypothetical protein